MKIDPTGTRSSSAVRRSGTGQSNGAAFARALGEQSGPSSTTGAAPMGGASFMLAAQEVADPLAGRGRARRRGNLLLDKLEDVRNGLLMGAIPKQRLQELSMILDSAQEQSSDPELDDIIREIQVRAAVELAKLSQRD